ncbi:MAG TPA: hypothetical protein VFC29_07775, partial [Candidatus Limnocylindrales bacterium]|nr:hypothetical protein [Candidatus Limnocylindrales bacterium]
LRTDHREIKTCENKDSFATVGSIKQLHKETGSLSERLMGKQCVQALRLERFHNSFIRVARVERRFSAAFSAAKRPAQAAEVDDLSGLSDFLFLPYTRA